MIIIIIIVLELQRKQRIYNFFFYDMYVATGNAAT